MPGRSRQSLLRFDRVERCLHWVNAAMFGVLILTAVPLYVTSVSAAVGRRQLIADIHLWTGVCLPVPLAVAVAGRWGRRLRADLGRLNRFGAEELAWLRSLGRDPFVRLDKFNPGQKLNAAFVAGAGIVMLGTGSILHWFSPFPNSWRTGATFVHDVVAFMILAVIVGHISFALSDRDALRSMFTGRVSEAWARRRAPLWVEEEGVSEPRPRPRAAGPAATPGA